MGIQDVLNLLEDPDFRETGSGHYSLETPFEIKPNEFLKFAKEDLESQSLHKDINALSNAKRALDCQLDSLLYALGLYQNAQNENWNFPKKIEIVKELGIVAPKVLEKINKKRNLMEHEYVKPNSEQVIDFIDIVELFFVATSKYLNYFNEFCSFQIMRDRDQNKYQVISSGEIQLENGQIKINLTRYVNDQEQEPESIEINNKDPEYIKVLGKYLQVAMKY
jgi:hypothetical protein